MAEYPWRPLGELLVARGLVDDYQLESLLLEQRLTGQLFGEMLVQKKIVSPDDMAGLIAEQHGLHLDPERRPARTSPDAAADGEGNGRWRPLGRILVEQGLLTESGLQRVLLAQRRKGGLLGQMLLERGYVTSEELAAALAEQHGLDIDTRSMSPATTQPGEAFFEVRTPGSGEEEPPFHVSPSFLDASDFAFELLYDEDPDALQIVEVTDGERKIAWAYERPDARSV